MATVVYSRASLVRSTTAVLGALRAWLSRFSAPHLQTSEAGEELRLREYLERPGGVSESVESLADKFGVSRRQCRRLLEHMVEQGTLRRTDFRDMQPIYSRFPTRSIS